MHRGNDLQLSRLDEIRHDLAPLPDVLRSQFGVGDGGLLDEFVIVRITLAVKFSERFDRGLDILEHRREVAELDLVDRALDRAAVVMAKDDDRLGARNLCREFQTADDVGVDEISSDARTENIADALIEDQFG